MIEEGEKAEGENESQNEEEEKEEPVVDGAKSETEEKENVTS